jgi:hypothetical protein
VLLHQQRSRHSLIPFLDSFFLMLIHEGSVCVCVCVLNEFKIRREVQLLIGGDLICNEADRLS